VPFGFASLSLFLKQIEYIHKTFHATA